MFNERFLIHERNICSIGAAIGAVGNVAGASITASADMYAANLAQQRYEQTRGDLAPFTNFGKSELPALGTQLGNVQNLLSGNPQQVQAQLESTPGYQFALKQGLKSVQQGVTARGLGVSGASQKAAAAYGTGLAQQTYAQQVGLQNTQVSNLLNASGLGENAAAQTGFIGSQLASTQANALMTGGQSIGQGITAGANYVAPYLSGAYGSNAMVGTGAGADSLNYDPGAGGGGTV